MTVFLLTYGSVAPLFRYRGGAPRTSIARVPSAPPTRAPLPFGRSPETLAAGRAYAGPA